MMTTSNSFEKFVPSPKSKTPNPNRKIIIQNSIEEFIWDQIVLHPIQIQVKWLVHDPELLFSKSAFEIYLWKRDVKDWALIIDRPSCWGVSTINLVFILLLMGAINQVAKSYITLLKAGSIYGMNTQVLDTTISLFIHLQKNTVTDINKGKIWLSNYIPYDMLLIIRFWRELAYLPWMQYWCRLMISHNTYTVCKD